MAPSKPPPDPLPELIARVVTEAEGMLAAQLTVALAADQRAMVFAGFLFTAAASLVGGGTSLVLNLDASRALGLVAVAAGISLTRAAWLAVEAAKPVTFWLVGNSPSAWAQDLSDCRSLADCMADVAVDLERRIEANDALLKSNAANIDRARNLALNTLIVGAGGCAGIAVLALIK